MTWFRNEAGRMICIREYELELYISIGGTDIIFDKKKDKKAINKMKELFEVLKN